MLDCSSALRRLWSEIQRESGTGMCRRMVRQVYREWHSYGLRRDLQVPFESPRARIPLMVRLLNEEDISQLFPGERAGLSRRARLEEADRVALLAEQLATPYVAVDSTCDRPCFLQWLCTARSNDFVQRYFRGRFPLLRDDEALLEYAFTPPSYRGNGIMPAAMSMIAEKAAQYGVRYVVTYVSRDNPAALQGCAKAGFSPYVLRHDRSFLRGLIRKRRFTPIESALGEGSVEAGPRMLVGE
jgi:GNAT superfamily N-acetyltransferase